MTPFGGMGRTALLLALLMTFASASAVILRPEKRLADVREKLRLEQAIPRQFGEWHIDEALVPIQPSPDVQARLDKIYSQTLSRTYVNQLGQRVMLSIAYGADQRDGMQIHKPEVCYPAQGFQVNRIYPGLLKTSLGEISVKRVETALSQRVEPVTYWIAVGDRVASSGFQKKVIEVEYAGQGLIPDGLLFRVSSISRDAKAAFRLHDEFVDELLRSLSPDARKRIAGL